MTDLNALDRCDRCGAQALVVTVHFGNVLMWCGHHFNKHEDLLSPCVIHDERKKLART